jgi:hypothetical protein
LPQAENWNRALEYFEPGAAYMKMVHADDWIYPECLSEMVAVAERNPSVGIVSAFRLEETIPGLGGIPSGQVVTPGRDACRRSFQYQVVAFGSPTNILVRGDLVRRLKPFYNPIYVHSDFEVCLRLLQLSDLGFVFKLLTFTRRHNESYTSQYSKLDTPAAEDLVLFREYGPQFFSETEFDRMMEWRIRNHYRFLSKAVLQRRSKEFWKYQKSAMTKAGTPLSHLRLSYSVLLALLNIADAIRNIRRSRLDASSQPLTPR